MVNKKRSGLTLLEMVLSLGLLVVVMAAASTALMVGVRAFAANSKIQEDQYNARMTVLQISKELHAGVTEVTADTSAQTLILKPSDTSNGATITYSLVDGALLRNNVDTSVRLLEFRPTLTANGRVVLTFKGENGLDIKTKIAQKRVPIE